MIGKFLIAAVLIDSSCRGFHATTFQQSRHSIAHRKCPGLTSRHVFLNRLNANPFGNDDDIDEEDVLRRVVEQEDSGIPIDLPIADLSDMKHKYTEDDWDGRGPIERGDMNGLDDPRDVEWRIRGQDLIREAIAPLNGISVYDITWNIGDLTVFIENEELGVSMEDIIDCTKAIQDTLEPFDDELEILSRHTLEVSSKGIDDVLTAERQFITFKGFEVAVSTISTFSDRRAPILGRLVGRDVHETTINQKGRMVNIPNFYVEEVRLVKKKKE